MKLKDPDAFEVRRVKGRRAWIVGPGDDIERVAALVRERIASRGRKLTPGIKAPDRFVWGGRTYYVCYTRKEVLWRQRTSHGTARGLGYRLGRHFRDARAMSW